ncbi:MAG: SLBB domain-containing protein [Clostridia bacterium]|nr:SLBB domain-containing protein [Clostridia bacterium]
MTIKELAKILQDNGVCGAGGAGFPSHAKLNEKADTIILNCAECEPLLKVHRHVLKAHTFEILKALQLVCETVGAKDCIIATKPSYKRTVEALREALPAFPGIRLSLIPETYPAGDEVITIFETTGRVVPPGDIPISVGVSVYNVETAYNIYRAVWENKPVTHKYVTMAGEVKNSVTLHVPIGTSFTDLIRLAGGATVEKYSLLSGGPMMGNPVSPSDVVTKTTNAILVLPENHPVIIRKQNKTNINIKRVMSACCQCKTCTDMCPRHLLGHPIEPSEIMRAVSSGKVSNPEAIVNAAYCSGCGVCELYACPQSLSPKAIIQDLKMALKASGQKLPEPQFDAVSDKRPYRQIPKARVTARLGLTEYNKLAPLTDEIPNVSTVKVKLSQHAGAPAVACVKEGDAVAQNQIIGTPKEKALSNAIHAPIDGIVSVVCEQFIVIKKEAHK